MDPLAAVLAVVTDALCPERCAACTALVTADRLFCHACRALVNVLGPPQCVRCGHPRSPAGTCRACPLADDRPIRYARAYAAYHGGEGRSPVAEALAAFKYAGMQRLGRRLAGAMHDGLPALPDVVVPVPLHPRRLRQRGFNQSAVLARHLARALDRPAALAALTRVRDTPTQTALSARARAANVARAFTAAAPGEVRDRAVLLVDDVWTSGATARAAAAALCDAGARAVDVLTFARVLVD